MVYDNNNNEEKSTNAGFSELITKQLFPLQFDPRWKLERKVCAVLKIWLQPPAEHGELETRLNLTTNFWYEGEEDSRGPCSG